MSRLKVYIDTFWWFVRRNNTDVAYMKTLKELESYIPVTCLYPDSLCDDLKENALYIKRRLLKTAPLSEPDDYMRRLPRKVLKASGADLVLNHRRFPNNTGAVPVVWQYAVLDPAMGRAYGQTQEEQDREIKAVGPVFARAAAIQVSTEAEAIRHRALFPALAERFQAVPFFLPHVKSIGQERMRDKQKEEKKLRVLFVGNEGWRKGVDIVAQALGQLEKSERARLRFDCVSRGSRKNERLCIEGLETHLYEGLSREAVRALMEQAHIFVMPSRFESYGFVYVEAMAAGCAVIAPSWEVQKELTDNGRAGINVAPDPVKVAEALSACLESKKRQALGQAALERFEKKFSPCATAQAYLSLFEAALSQGGHGKESV